MVRTKKNEDLPVVGLVLRDGSLGRKVEAVLEAAGYTIAFQVPLAGIDELPSGDHVVVVAAGKGSSEQGVFEKIRADQPEARVVACLPEDEPASVRWVIDNQVDGVVYESRVEETLNVTLRAIGLGQRVLPRDLPERTRAPVFTNREKQTLSLMIMGLTNHEIAEKLFIAEATVKSHLNTAYRKLGVHSRAEAMRAIADPEAGLGTGILAITGPGLRRSRGG